MLSLVLFAVVGGALAFKAKLDESYCTTIAYFDQNIGYYCSFKPLGLPTTTKQCGAAPVGGLFPDASGVLKVCTSTPLEEGCPSECPELTSLKPF